MSDDLIHLMIFLGAINAPPAAAPPPVPTAQSAIQTPQMQGTAARRGTVAAAMTQMLPLAQRITAAPAGGATTVALWARGRLPENE